MPEITSRTVSVYPFRRQGGVTQCLALLRSRGLPLEGTWQAVHGKIEPGEKARDAALRELCEETGLAPQRFYATNYVEVIFDPDADEFNLVPVFAAEVDGQARVILSHEHEAAEWCTVEEVLGRFVWPTQREAVRSIVEDIAEPARPNPLLELPLST